MRMKYFAPLLAASLLAPCLHAQQHSIQNAAIRVSFNSSGAYTITDTSTHWSLTGNLPEKPASIRVTSATDSLGAYKEIDARYQNGARTAAIRLYRNRAAVLFLDEHKAAAPNSQPFPQFTALPADLYRFSYAVKTFAPFEFGKLGSQGPWILFDSTRDTMVLSPADNYLVADLTASPSGQAQSGIDPQITTLPAGFTHRTLLTFGHGINHTLNAWGADLQSLNDKPRVPNDAGVMLKKFGYWTDHGAIYYYKFDPALGYEGTLLAVRDQYKKLGVPIAYLQLDSWWYPKAKGNTLEHGSADNGALIYRANPKIFPNGLDAFHQQLGLPMVTHARWFSPLSPYRKEYRFSKNVIIDPRFWNSTAEYLHKGGVTVYEQDWLNDNARPAIKIAQSHAFLADMAHAMARENIAIQYCMPLPGYYLASTQFANLRTIRVSDDRFERARYNDFLYGSELAHAVGLWPWSDVFMSDELENLVLSTLSAGPVGVGDALGKIDAANLKRVMRADSVILKPDTPLVPIDATYLADAAAEASHRQPGPMLAMTRTNFGSATEDYVFAYPRNGSGDAHSAGTTVPLRELGIHSPVYAWNWQTQQGEIVPANGSINMQYANGWAYDVLAPVNKRGIALLGDTSKIVPLARQRFAAVSNNGAIHATILFATREKSVALTGYSTHKPRVRARRGSISDLHYDATAHTFTFNVSPSSTAPVTIEIR